MAIVVLIKGSLFTCSAPQFISHHISDFGKSMKDKREGVILD
jgi:hypothetical protein